MMSKLYFPWYMYIHFVFTLQHCMSKPYMLSAIMLLDIVVAAGTWLELFIL